MSGFDDIDSDIAAAIESTKSPATPSTGDAAPPSDTKASAPSTAPEKPSSPSEGERARDDSGRFVAKTEEKPAPAEKKSDAPAETATGAQAQAPASTIAAPPHWKGSGKIAWASLSPDVQKHIADDYARWGKMESDHQGWSSVIPPERAQAFAAQYGSTQEAVRRLLAISDYASRDKPGFIRWFAEQNRIDLNQLVQGASPQNGSQPLANADPNPLASEVASLRNQLQQFTQQQHQQAQSAVMAEVNRFKSDPAHPYFNDVEGEIIALLPKVQGTPSERLKQAYDMACWANPSIRENLIKDHREKLAKEDAQRVAQARSAAGSVNGSPKGAVVASDEPDTDLESLVRKQVNALA